MPTRNVVLTDHQAELVDDLVARGIYQNASEVLRDGLRLIELRDAEHKAKLKALRTAVQVGIDDIEAGRYSRFATEADLRAHLKFLAQEGKRRRAQRQLEK
ncbi:MAG TPA: type II toxin-antitoxin system ParD family antitoxin [Micropepsaceae bacterium]|nr:type II toxin-antitoxin system ParD family antitoxin [Micropepsaceae bacterium]